MDLDGVYMCTTVTYAVLSGFITYFCQILYMTDIIWQLSLKYVLFVSYSKNYGVIASIIHITLFASSFYLTNDIRLPSWDAEIEYPIRSHPGRNPCLVDSKIPLVPSSWACPVLFVDLYNLHCNPLFIIYILYIVVVVAINHSASWSWCLKLSSRRRCVCVHDKSSTRPVRSVWLVPWFNFVIWGFPHMKVPQNGWFLMENPINMDLGVFHGVSISGNLYMIGFGI